ncbi:MAG TPA: HAD family hydrolase [Chloroflexia bacterium]|nr:HAD family hydrolase [Chloroflexia bacterium]
MVDIKTATMMWPVLATPPKAILFDMDGTLVQLHPAGRMVVLNETLADFGLPPLSDMEQVERFWFTSERYAMIDSWGIERPYFWKAFDSERLLEMQLHHTYAFEDVGAALNRLRIHDLRLGIVSNSAHISLGMKLDLLEQYIERHHFEVVVSCNDDVPCTKPSADGVELALNLLNVEPHEAVLVGDSVDDIGAGKAAGVRVLVVDRGQLPTLYKNISGKHSEDDFEVIDSLHQLPAYLGLPALPLSENWAA